MWESYLFRNQFEGKMDQFFFPITWPKKNGFLIPRSEAYINIKYIDENPQINESSLPFLIDFCATESWNPPEENGEDPGDGEHDVRPVQGPLVVGEREADGLWEGNKKRDFDFDLGVCLSIGHAIPLSNFQLPTKPF